jgi:thymidylate kinase
MEEEATLPLIYRLCREFENEKVVYCHWKSNAAISRSASGDNDLDLLVDRASADRFIAILCRFGFKQMRIPSKKLFPGVLDYFGYDKESDKLVHVHAHFQLVLGHDATKNYHLPIEKPYLESSFQDTLFRIPAPEFEFIVFVIRMVLKHSTWDVILARQGNLSAGEQQELEYLQAQVDQSKNYGILKKCLPCMHAELFDACLRSLQRGCPYWIRIKAGRELQKSLKAHARRPQISDLYLRLWRPLVGTIKSRVLKYKPLKRTNSGGLMVAIVGGDGSGKSTVVEGLYSWLSPRFATIKIHMGKPNWSLSTTLVRGVLKIGRSVGLYPFSRAPIQATTSPNSSTFPGYPTLIRAVCTARDRYHAYVKARRFANKGGIAICDRLPLPQVKFMDGPQVEQMAATYSAPANRFVSFLAKLEKKYYESILPPELMIMLRVDPETAVQRKTDEDAVFVRARSALVWEMDWHQVSAQIVDANQSKADVLSELKPLVWSAL